MKSKYGISEHLQELGLKPRTKKWRALYLKLWNESNPGYRKESQRVWYALNKERIRVKRLEKKLAGNSSTP